MDQQKRGEFVMVVSFLIFINFFSFEGWKLWPLRLRIWNKATRNSFDTVQMNFVTLDGIFNLKLVVDYEKQ